MKRPREVEPLELAGRKSFQGDPRKERAHSLPALGSPESSSFAELPFPLLPTPTSAAKSNARILKDVGGSETSIDSTKQSYSDRSMSSVSSDAKRWANAYPSPPATSISPFQSFSPRYSASGDHIYSSPSGSPVRLVPSPLAAAVRLPSGAMSIDRSTAGSGSSYRGSVDDGPQIRGGASVQEEARSWLARTRTGKSIGLSSQDVEAVNTLGTGTFGKVLLVRLRKPRPDLPTYLAMKVLNKSEVVRMGQVEHINWERAILAGVQHASLVNLICTFQDERNLYILMEFVQGGELFTHLRRAVRFTADVARFYCANIVLVLEHMHSLNIVYRDLKPENLLLDLQGYVKLTDCGFAKYVPDRTYTLCGTPHFLAPETIRGIGHGKAADWWALGILLYEFLCGYPPFFDENPLVIYEKIVAGHVIYPPYIDPLAKDLIKRLLTPDLSRRIGNLRNGALDIKLHSWFAGVNWDALLDREVPAPIVPCAKSSSDTAHFERYPPVNLHDLPALQRAALRRGAGDKYIESEIPIDPHKNYFEAFG